MTDVDIKIENIVASASIGKDIELSEVKEASEQGRCDIMFGGGIESYEAAKDLFMPYEPVERSALDPDYVDDEYFAQIAKWYDNRFLIYGSQVIQNSAQPKPRRWVYYLQRVQYE